MTWPVCDQCGNSWDSGLVMATCCPKCGAPIPDAPLTRLSSRDDKNCERPSEQAAELARSWLEGSIADEGLIIDKLARELVRLDSLPIAPSSTSSAPVDPESEAANPVWDLVIAKCHSAYPERQGMSWGESPLELITEIINDRDEAVRLLAEGVKLSAKNMVESLTLSATLRVSEGESLWLIETSTLAVKGDPTYPQRHFWTGRGWHFDPLQAARYVDKYAAEIVREKEKMYPLDKYPVCGHMFQCGVTPEPGR